VNTASESDSSVSAGSGPYCASKFAVVGLSEALFQELALSGKDVHVTVLCRQFRTHSYATTSAQHAASFAAIR